MVNNKNIIRLKHIIECIDKIDKITENLSYGDYLEDWMKQDAVLRNISIIGEAISKVDEDLKKNYSDVPWSQAKGMRNFLIHEYFKVDHDAVWFTFKNDLPSLKIQILQIINDIDKN
jgi:uncharacterized protein with HEPN domain